MVLGSDLLGRQGLVPEAHFAHHAVETTLVEQVAVRLEAVRVADPKAALLAVRLVGVRNGEVDLVDDHGMPVGTRY
mgnify:CR=1 FL=1